MENYLQLYNAWATTGRIPTNGLCAYFGSKHELFSLFFPGNDHMQHYWGYDGEDSDHSHLDMDYDDIAELFTEYRQNIVLFMAAMNGEL
jgi:hypothetical protein